MDPVPSVINSTLIWRKVTHSESGTACPRWTHKSTFACIILPPYLVTVWLPCVAMTYSIVAFQLKAANVTVCVTNPLEKSAPLLPEQKPNQGVKSSPVLLHQIILAVLCFLYTWDKPVFPKKPDDFLNRCFVQSFSADSLSIIYPQPWSCLVSTV